MSAYQHDRDELLSPRQLAAILRAWSTRLRTTDAKLLQFVCVRNVAKELDDAAVTLGGGR